jgi:hypothetical protein
VTASRDEVVDAAQRVAGTVAARGRGDIEGARALLSSFEDHAELSGGALLVAELALGLLSEATGEDLDSCVEGLNLRLMSLGS